MNDFIENLNFVRFLCLSDKTTVLDDFLLCSRCENVAASKSNEISLPLSSYTNGTMIISDSEVLNHNFKCNSVAEILKLFPKCPIKRILLNGYCHSLFKYILNFSNVYRNLVLLHFLNRFGQNCRVLNVIVGIEMPSRHIVDYKWNYMLLETCQERRELEVAMSWLSTLGGAFSSLGDNFEYCAITAGKISAHQFRLALRLGDPITVVRCKLYYAISLIQRKNFHLAAKIVKSQYRYIHTFPVVDRRIVSMCLGIWSKLKYEKSFLKSRGIR